MLSATGSQGRGRSPRKNLRISASQGHGDTTRRALQELDRNAPRIPGVKIQSVTEGEPSRQGNPQHPRIQSCQPCYLMNRNPLAILQYNVNKSHHQVMALFSLRSPYGNMISLQYKSLGQTRFSPPYIPQSRTNLT
jgi:hypothetical protein